MTSSFGSISAACAGKLAPSKVVDNAIRSIVLPRYFFPMFVYLLYFDVGSTHYRRHHFNRCATEII